MLSGLGISPTRAEKKEVSHAQCQLLLLSQAKLFQILPSYKRKPLAAFALGKAAWAQKTCFQSRAPSLLPLFYKPFQCPGYKPEVKFLDDITSYTHNLRLAHPHV